MLEATRVAGGASGKAGGLLAVWAYPSQIVPLSFALHEQLAAEHGGDERWGYRRVSCGNLEAVGRKRSDLDATPAAVGGLSLGKRTGATAAAAAAAAGGRGVTLKGNKAVPEDLDWVLPELITGYEKMGGARETAQVHPYYFTMALMRLAEDRGARLIIGSVTGINYAESSPSPSPSSPTDSPSSGTSSSRGRKHVASVSYTTRETGAQELILPATTAVLAAGPWTSRLYPTAPITGLRAHSVTITPASDVSAHTLFTEITIPPSADDSNSDDDDDDSSSGGGDGGAYTVSPEIYARPNNEIYVCGEGDMDADVPETTADVEVDEDRCDELIAQVSSISEHIRLGRVTRKQACYLPILNVGGSGGPLIGETGTPGLLMASGHSCWGINNAPATGLLLSEMIFEGQAKSADVRALDPRRIL